MGKPSFHIRPSAFLVLLAIAGSAQATLEECAAIDEPVQRLACYDGLAAQAGASIQRPDERFGKTAKPATTEPEHIAARLVGPFTGWKPGDIFRLDNGQVWKAAGDDDGYYPGIPDNPGVTIRRNWFGAYWMKVEGVSRQFKVRRVS